MSINERIKEVRKKYKLNQKSFGEKLGLTQSATSWIEQEGNTVIEQNIKQICTTFNVSEKWLRTGEGEMFCASKTDILQKLNEEMQLNPTEQILVKAMLNLAPEQRVALVELIKSFAEQIKKAEADKTAPADEPIAAQNQQPKAADSEAKKKNPGRYLPDSSIIDAITLAPRVTPKDLQQSEYSKTAGPF